MSFFYSCMSDLLDICTTIAFKDFFSQEEKRKHTFSMVKLPAKLTEESSNSG